MNILPKKRWHVRTKENIARVRKDEAEAAEKDRQERLRTEIANREARLNILKKKSKQKLLECGIIDNEPKPSVANSEHVNLFVDLDHAVGTTNKEHDKETKEKKEEYEKKIGYLTYLGQDTNEALKKKNWYEVLPESRLSNTTEIKDTYDKLVFRDIDGKPKSKELDIKNGEMNWKSKQSIDPINKFKKHCNNTVENKSNSVVKIVDDYSKLISTHKPRKSDKDTKKQDKLKKIQKLREARIKRELQEKHKTELFLSGFNKCTVIAEDQNVKKVKAKYNSQFNPELARQNYM
ncbi:leukocyte receptor cluster member 1 homolog [Achroia grisella]|uniref:leukocyte receptor cluster member 1 homolog n=1 Tax=Achroia grisella TaxID=688607 RepID=UPI0027D25449|nr:leukocyte receptor cluster member 1 homolog [Achroia grisella]